MNIRIALMILAVMSSSAIATTMYGTSSSDFDVKATIDSFVGKAVSDPFEIKSGDQRVAIVYEIAKMETGKKKRDKEMMHMFHADEFPSLSGSADVASIMALQPSEEAIDLPIEFTMHGVTREVTGKVTNINRTETGLSFEVAFPLALSDFGLKAPSVMMMIRVNNIVNVTSRVALSSEPPSEVAE